MKRTAGAFAFLVLILLWASPALWSLSSIEFDGGMVFIGNTDTASAPSPLLPSLGMSFPILERKFWGLDSGFLLLSTYYQYESGRATPVELENRDFVVFGILADARAGLHVTLGRVVTLGLNGGLVLFLRVPVPLFADAGPDFGPTLGYFYGKARALYPETELFVRFPLMEALDLRLAVRAYYPVFHLWDGESLPFWDQFILSGLIGIVYRLPPRKS